MKILYWGWGVPKLIEVFSKNLRKLKMFSDFCIQVPTGMQAVGYCNIQADEILRTNVWDMEELRKFHLENNVNHISFIMDTWDIILSENFEVFLQKLPDVLRLEGKRIFLGPKSWSDQWKTHPLVKDFSAFELKIFEQLFHRCNQIIELIINNNSTKLMYLEFSPTVEMLSNICGRSDLNYVNTLGFNFFPNDFYLNIGKFQDLNALCNVLIEYFRDEIDSCVLSLSGSIELRDFYDVKNNRGNLYKNYASSFTFKGTSWHKYCQERVNTVAYNNFNIGDLSVTQEIIARWFAFLSILEGSSKDVLQKSRDSINEIFTS